jgi:hypothetical protein
MSLWLRSLFDIALALASSVTAWPLRALPSRVLAALVASTVLALAAGAALALPLYPWTNLLVLAFAAFGGLLLGRALPARARPVFLVLLLASLADLALNGLPSPLPPESGPRPPLPTPLLYGNVVVFWPGGDRYMLGGLDLLLCAALTEHRRRRGGPPAVALLPGPVAMALAAAFVLASRRGGLALVPFLLLGWLLSEVLARLTWPRR